LRSGVDVRHAGPALDLRRTPSIWGYARKAGYRTTLIDGQTSGAPQNLLLPPERALIDEVVAAAGAMDTDMRIADLINRRLRGGQRTFVYAVLRGVHFQYRDHFPAGLIPADSPTIRQYETAIDYSKGRFFDRLLAGVDRQQVAIVYTSDHGQNLAAGAVPHCSPSPVPAELHVPLVAFLPDRLAAAYADAPRAGHSASQIFPATLAWMGYDPAVVQQQYDNDLSLPPAGYVRFDRDVVPLHAGDPAGVIVQAGFPGAALAAKGG
ncbi:MAG TPA: sulfatase-like hydrolase/transferase, partial [Croceibacterium sp.]